MPLSVVDPILAKFERQTTANNQPLTIVYLTTPWQRAWGAMLKGTLEGNALVFVYPVEAPRVFHTFLCPALRITAFTEVGEILFNQVVVAGRFIRIPPTRFIAETSPEVELGAQDLRCLASEARQVSVDHAAWQVETSVDLLLFALLREAVADVRRVYEAHHRAKNVCLEVLQEKFTPFERGQIAHSADYILNFSAVCEIPETAVLLARQILSTEAEFADEISAASEGGIPWKAEFPNFCLRCGKAASWRHVLKVPRNIASEMSWRYERPENCVPLCRRCAAWLGWNSQQELRLQLVQALWGCRFDALANLHAALKSGRLPKGWNRLADPLWPPEFGGSSWDAGSGALRDAEPRPPEGVQRLPIHRNALVQAVTGRGGIHERRGRGKGISWQPFLDWLGISPEEIPQ